MDPNITQLAQMLSRAIVGKDQAIQLILAAFFSGGHALLEDVPGVGKTLLAKALARAVKGRFQRVQFTPDLLPTDLTGTNVWNPQTGSFEFIPGPVFTQVLLADEINRATPRTQAGLLEVMEEQQVTTDGVSRPVGEPFFVIATQNPVEYQGTSPLPEALLDRFAVSLSLGYPSENEELQMLQRLDRQQNPLDAITPCLDLSQVLTIRQACAQVKMTEPLQRYVLALIRTTRTDQQITLGASPRAAVTLQRVTQAWAYLQGRNYALPDDVKAIAPFVLAHRLIITGGRPGQEVIDRLLKTVAIP
ncbi:MoxR family ATPase [Candidatus Cyanaurora vandensis]|uniref:AAA family ATPase n=1 Tax=Candidatus Cyanaurora vandensis TaxID=2714958 RepID=UPI00257D4A7A|nr:MoxR family ATPase [Candidatus Cyanaurora vandensis]